VCASWPRRRGLTARIACEALISAPALCEATRSAQCDVLPGVWLLVAMNDYLVVRKFCSLSALVREEMIGHAQRDVALVEYVVYSLCCHVRS
jgi:hypothetical protein